MPMPGVPRKIHADSKKRRCAMLFATGDFWRSRDASRPANGAADYNPLALGRKAPSNKRIDRTPNRMNKFIRPGDAHSQRRWPKEDYMSEIIATEVSPFPHATSRMMVAMSGFRAGLSGIEQPISKSAFPIS